MRRQIAAALVAALVALAVTGQAMAGGGGGGLGTEQTQTATNSVTQDASSSASSTQTAPVNVDVPVRVLSPGDDNGDVSQSNSSDPDASARSPNHPPQAQHQIPTAGADGGARKTDRGWPEHPQPADNSVDQSADAQSSSEQTAPVNVNVPVRVLSPGNDNGDVHQSNRSGADRSARNTNSSDQSIDQDQTAGHSSEDGTQPFSHPRDSSTDQGQWSGEKGKDGGQSSSQSQDGSNSIGQDSSASSYSTQTEPVNVNAPVRILSPGDDNGDVHQSNRSDADAKASNKNYSDQSIDQSQGSSQGGWSKSKKGHDSEQSQTAANSITQSACASAISTQTAPVNVNTPVRFLSPGDDTGDVHQSNRSDADAVAKNHNPSTQSIDQSQSSGDKPAADSGKSGDEWCGGKEGGPKKEGPKHTSTQSQSASNDISQDAKAKAKSEQTAPTNVNAPLRFLSPNGCAGDTGSVDQRNSSDANAWASNWKSSTQTIGQGQEAGRTSHAQQDGGRPLPSGA